MGKKILIVDDDKDLVETITHVLKTKQYNVSVAYSGSEGLKKLLEVKPDLMVLDIMMEHDTAGFEIAYQIRDKRETSRYREVRNVPIIMLTAINQVTNSRFSLNEQESFLPEVNDFMTKPVNIDELLEKIGSIIG